MQSPIFSADTLFPCMTANGRKLCRGDDEPTLFQGVAVQRLKQPAELIEIETRSGGKLRLSSESVFSLVRDGGKVALFNPPDMSLATTAIPGWPSQITNVLDDYRRWFLVGLMLSGGNYSGDINRPGRIVVPIGEVKLIHAIDKFLQRVGGIDGFMSRRRVSQPSTITTVADRAILISRVLDKLVGAMLEAKTHRPFFDPATLSNDTYHAFVAGLLMGMKRATDGSRVFTHRDRFVIERMYGALNDRAGIPTSMRVQTMEPAMQYKKNVTDPHTLIVPASAISLCARLGLVPKHDKPKAKTPEHTGLRREEIVRVTPIGKMAACIVVSESDAPKAATANWFLFNPVFDVDPVHTDLAIDLLQDPAHPART